MKKHFWKNALAVLLMGCSMISTCVNAKGIQISVDGRTIQFEEAMPYMDTNNHILIPVRFVSEELGAKVSWDSKARQVTIYNEESTAKLFIGKQEVSVNGQEAVIDTMPVFKEQRMYVPLRFISEAFGADVRWDQQKQVVVIIKEPIEKEDEGVTVNQYGQIIEEEQEVQQTDVTIIVTP